MNIDSTTSFEPMVTPESFAKSLKEDEQRKKEKKPPGKSVRLEDCTADIIEYLQKKGTATFKEICNDLDIPYRRTSDVLNVLQTTPLITRQRKGEFYTLGKANTNPYQFCNGFKVNEPVNIATVLQDIEKEKTRIHELELLVEKTDKMTDV